MTEKIEARRIRDLEVWCHECNTSMNYLGTQEVNAPEVSYTRSIFLCYSCKKLTLINNGDYDGDPEDMILTLTHPIDPKEAEEFYLRTIKQRGDIKIE